MPLFIFDLYRQEPGSFITTCKGVVVTAIGRKVAAKLLKETVGDGFKVEFKKSVFNKTGQVIFVGPLGIVSGF